MKKISIYRPNTVDEAIQILSQHGTEAGVYAGGTDLLVRLKNRLTQAPELSRRHQENRQSPLHQGGRGRAACRSARRRSWRRSRTPSC